MTCQRPPSSVAWRRFAAVLLAVTLFASESGVADRQARTVSEVALTELLGEARETVALIRKGGPFPYERDGVAFGNFEKLLPVKERGYYREYTVKMPGTKSRGARRIVAGRGGELYYTDDHYKSFRRIKDARDR